MTYTDGLGHLFRGVYVATSRSARFEDYWRKKTVKASFRRRCVTHTRHTSAVSDGYDSKSKSFLPFFRLVEVTFQAHRVIQD